MSSTNESRDYLVTVCDACLKASCWHGEFMCEKSGGAGTLEVLASSLLHRPREHADYFSPEKMLEVAGCVSYVDIDQEPTE